MAVEMEMKYICLFIGTCLQYDFGISRVSVSPSRRKEATKETP